LRKNKKENEKKKLNNRKYGIVWFEWTSTKETWIF
jgi:hypothetical protein